MLISDHKYRMFSFGLQVFDIKFTETELQIYFFFNASTSCGSPSVHVYSQHNKAKSRVHKDPANHND